MNNQTPSTMRPPLPELVPGATIAIAHIREHIGRPPFSGANRLCLASIVAIAAWERKYWNKGPKKFAERIGVPLTTYYNWRSTEPDLRLKKKSEQIADASEPMTRETTGAPDVSTVDPVLHLSNGVYITGLSKGEILDMLRRLTAPPT